MTSFALSAPQITPQEEQREKDLLTDQEKQRIYIDLFGSHPLDKNIAVTNSTTVASDTEWSNDRCIRCMQMAIHDLPISEKQDYLAALDRNINAVIEESDLVAFMRSENFNAAVS
jgi:hypothetical protein